MVSLLPFSHHQTIQPVSQVLDHSAFPQVPLRKSKYRGHQQCRVPPALDAAQWCLGKGRGHCPKKSKLGSNGVLAHPVGRYPTTLPGPSWALIPSPCG